MKARTSKIKRLLALDRDRDAPCQRYERSGTAPAANLEWRFQLNFLFPR